MNVKNKILKTVEKQKYSRRRRKGTREDEKGRNVEIIRQRNNGKKVI